MARKSSTVRFRCLSCGKKYKAPDAHRGKTSWCSRCGERLFVPKVDHHPSSEREIAVPKLDCPWQAKSRPTPTAIEQAHCGWLTSVFRLLLGVNSRNGGVTRKDIRD